LHERERGREGEQQTRVMDLRDNKLDRLTDKVSLAREGERESSRHA
jgi:hypothetical protein